MVDKQPKGLTEKDGDTFWLLLEEAKRLYMDDGFLPYSTITCMFCGKKIKPAVRIPNFSQHANIVQSMDGHIKGHIRRGEITWENLYPAKEQARDNGNK